MDKSKNKNVKQNDLIWDMRIKDDRNERSLNNKCDNFVSNIEGIKKIILNEDKFNEAIELGSKEIIKIEKKRKANTDISEKTFQNIYEAKKLRDEIKKDIKEILKMNLAYVEKSKKLMLKEEPLSLLNNKLPKIEKLPDNFKFVTGNVRQQLMRAFLNFNPIIHLNNLKNLLAKADPDILLDIKNLSENIEKDSQAYLDPYYYKKKWEKIRSKNEIIRKHKNSENINIMRNSDNQIVRSNKRKPSIKLYKNILTDKSRIKKNKEKFDEIDKLRKYVQEIVNSIQEDNIERYIDKIKDDPKLKYETYFNEYFPAFKKTEDFLINIQNNQHNKQIEELNTNLKSINDNKDELLKHIQFMKSKLLNNILNYDKFDL